MRIIPSVGRVRAVLLGAAAALGLWAPAPAPAATLIRAEGDWSIVLGTPAPNKSSPQLALQKAASSSPDYYFQFHINYADNPNYADGGLEIAAYSTATGLQVTKTRGSLTAALSTSNETITFTHYIDVSSGVLKYGVINGSSTTWGSFSLGPISVSQASASLANYNLLYTVQNSGPTFGGQRLVHMNPTMARLYYSDGTMTTIPVPGTCFDLAQLSTYYQNANKQ